MLTDVDLEAMLAAGGWPYERLDDKTWRSGFRAPGHEPFRFFLRLTSDWLCLTIVPFVTIPADSDGLLHVYRRLLELNREITFAKLGIDKDVVLLTVELPRQDLVASILEDALDALVHYASSLHEELENLIVYGGTPPN